MSFISLSIIIPVYNVEQYIAQCLDSIYSQNIPEDNYEVICVNDGSQDNSRDIILKYKDLHSNLSLIDQPNAGLSAARNTGFKASKGKYVYFLDSDDYLLPEAMNTFITHAQKTQDEMICFNVEKNGVAPYFNRNIKISSTSGLDFIKSFNSQARFHFPPPVWLYLYEREFLIRHNLYNCEGILHEDEEFTPRCLFYVNRISLDNRAIQYHRVQREGSITSSMTHKHIESIFVILHNLYVFYEKNNAAQEFYTSLLYLVISKLNQLINLNKLSLWRQYAKSQDIKIINKLASKPFEKKTCKLLYINARLSVNYFYGNLHPLVNKIINKLL